MRTSVCVPLCVRVHPCAYVRECVRVCVCMCGVCECVCPLYVLLCVPPLCASAYGCGVCVCGVCAPCVFVCVPSVGARVCV